MDNETCFEAIQKPLGELQFNSNIAGNDFNTQYPTCGIALKSFGGNVSSNGPVDNAYGFLISFVGSGVQLQFFFKKITGSYNSVLFFRYGTAAWNQV